MSTEVLSTARHETNVYRMTITLLDGTSLTIAELGNRFFESNYGMAMQQQTLRFYANYGYNRNDMLRDNGTDMCPIGHQRDLPRYLNAILNHENQTQSLFSTIISDDDIQALGLACIKHDIGESTHADLVKAGLTPVGDIRAGQKTDADRLHEKEIRQFFYQQLFADVPVALLRRVEAIISHDEDSPTHDLYQASHELQSLDTTLRAEDSLFELEHHAQGMPYDMDQHVALYGLSHQVRDTVRASLKKYRHLGLVEEAYQMSAAHQPEHRPFDAQFYHAKCSAPGKSVLNLAAA